ncbi:hypothetical protein [Fluviicola sp.]|jgi:hypothetical protein|uniref:hypothetical protein n=1 Tax=Fluviicola sp. TaxID=1917219 RepID=UPI002817F9B2|nr:hypothetical protein [Fluviicola sp.]MDR0802491.1 hypothetical protein [Fluviicola sp.]
MKNDTTYSHNTPGIQADALFLAILMLIQTFAPLFLYGTPAMADRRFSGFREFSQHIFPAMIFRKSSEKTAGNPKRNYNGTFQTAKTPDTEEAAVLPDISKIPGGPDQPEVQSFTPISSDNVVDLFSGDFSYNIPLLDIDGYPVNLSYNAGIGMEQESSWVGLGWNLNPGVVNRQMRGIPDDFNGVDKITQEYNQKPNWTVGTSVGADYEIFAVKIPKVGGSAGAKDTIGGINISAKLGVEYNNYTGFGADFSIGPSFSIAKKIGFECGLEFTGSSQGGASVGTHVTLSDGNDEGSKVSNKLSIGSSFNSRQGLQQVSINFSRDHKIQEEDNYTKYAKSHGAMKTGSAGSGLGSSYNFGMSSFVPQIPFDTRANSFTARFKLGGDVFGNDLTGTFTGFFTKSSLTANNKSLSAYGYSNLEKGQQNSNAMLDFNRENNASFTKNTPALPIPHLMYDIFSVSGQGISGSYRMDRRDIGFVFDPAITSSTNSYTIGGEVGLGTTAKAGVDVGGVFTSGRSGAWTDGNDASGNVRFNSGTNFFRDASELSYDESDTEFQNIGGAKAAYFSLTNTRKLSNSLKTSSGDTYIITNAKSLRFRRNQPLTSFTVSEIRNGYGPTKLPTNAYANAQPGISHHTGAFTVTKMDGSRYYYGLPAYSYMQKNVSFAVGEGKNTGLTPNWDTRLVTYSDQDASIANHRGLDNHFNAQTVPAYAHSYMLTAVLSNDYEDSDPIPGLSKGDLGSYVEFKYRQIQQYKWRNPVNASQAFHDRGLNADPTDDKANYIYGEKELWYLDTIRTKNHLLIFYTSDRKDAVSVNNEAGGISYSSAKMQKLDSLKLYSLPDFEVLGTNATPLKAAHFVYDYSLCTGYPGNVDASDPSQSGKLTLKSVYFTYEKSYRGERSPFKFTYDYNPSYNANSIDRWGTYRPNPTDLTGDEKTDPLTNSDFPYVGYDKNNSDQWAAAWNLSHIKLPTGAVMEIIYESDDYAYVQHKRAKQMFKIIGVEGCSESKCSISNDAIKNRKLYFEMIPGTSIQDYAEVGNTICFRALLSMNEDADRFDYVPGYAVIEEIGMEGGNGYVKLKPNKLKDSESSASYNPIAITGVQFARNYLSRIIPPSSQANPQSEGSNFLDVANSLIGAFTSFGELFTGPNRPIWNKEIGTILITGKSWIRLNNPNYIKLGGGHRVKEIRTYDSWDQMVEGGTQSYYGQQYQYTFDGKSSGVASYEPPIGGEENVWRDYVANDIKLTLAPDIRNYMETPFGEQFFPSPMVGYSKVLVKNLQREGVKRTATGYTISEFYTARDFPTITEKTGVDKKTAKFNLNLLLYAQTEDMMAASQGFVVEGNDMHGKPRSVRIFAEGQQTAYSSVNYYYQSFQQDIEGVAANHLDNNITVITPSGTVKTAVVGKTYEAVADFRENKSRMKSANIGINLNYTMPFILVPMILGANYSESKTEFRSAVFAKTIERKGILRKVVAEDYNSTIETENLAYDAETGDVLLTSVNNSFRDTVYNFTYPAHWIYDRMGQAYKNLGYTSAISNTFSDGYSTGFTSANLLEGDEVIVIQSGNYIKGWVTESGILGVRILEKDGTPLEGTISYLKVIRSGNRNLQAVPVGTVTLMKNPLKTLSGNVLDRVLTAQSIEYSDTWKTFCDCNDSVIRNPYVAGLKGNWNPKANYLHLSDRTQTFENNNTNIRKDGLMKSFTPFFRLNGGKWSINKENWTYTSEATEFSPFGQAIESVDALKRYSSTQFGYNQTLSVAVAANAMRKQAGFNNFEDYGYESCPDSHFRFGTNANITSSDAHTGKYSIRVSLGSPVILQKQLAEICDMETACDFSRYIIYLESKPTQINVMDVDGITMSYEILYGNPTPVMNEIPGGISLSFTSSGAFKVEVKLVKSNGCMTIVPITNP